MNSPNVVEVNQILKRNYSLLIRGLLLRFVIFGALCATPVVLAKTGVWDSPVLALLSVAGVLGFVLMAYRFPFAYWEKFAADREQAGPVRVERARRTLLAQRVR